MSFEEFGHSKIIDQRDSDHGEKKPEEIKQETESLIEDIAKTRRERRDEFMLGQTREREIPNPFIQEARRKRNQLLEARGLFSLSKREFEEYFASKEFTIRTDLKQGNTGDCYVVAAIHAMSRSPHFEMIVRSSMKKLSDGSWEVKIPLLSENGQVITITPDELLPQKNRQFMKLGKDGGIMSDVRRKLSPMKGKEGMQVLEAAFIKEKFGSVDRLEAEGGFASEVLLALGGGDNFRRIRLDALKFNEKKSKWEFLGLDSCSAEDMFYLDRYLEHFDPEIHIATVSTGERGKIANTIGLYKGKGTQKFFVPGHAYSISNVDPQKKIITLANPWNTSKPIALTFDQFKGTFCTFDAVRIDSAKLLKNMETVLEKAG